PKFGCRGGSGHLALFDRAILGVTSWRFAHRHDCALFRPLFLPCFVPYFDTYGKDNGEVWGTVIIAGTLIAGPSAYFLMRKADCGKVLSIIGGLVAPAVAAVILFVVANECELSAFLKANLEKGLLPSELVTLKAGGLFCPAGYTFVRD